MDTSLNVGIAGCGHWGRNLIRNFHALGALGALCDPEPTRLEALQRQYAVRAFSSYAQLLAEDDLQGIVIAAPASQHYGLARQALEARKHVLVEKPLALCAREAEELVRLAEASGRILMVGHLLVYHPAICRLKQLIREGVLGKVQYIYSSRLNFGKLRAEENILCSFAPHDVSAILWLLEEEPVSVAAHGGNYLNAHIADVTLTSCRFASGVTAHIFVSWLHPFKEQKLVIVGDRQMAVFDDTQPDRKLVLYSHQVDWVDRVPVARRSEGQAVALPADEPLRLECAHFLECIRTGRRPLTDGRNGVRVLRILNACERSLKNHGEVQDVQTPSPSFFADPTARVDQPCAIGEGTRIWHFSHVMQHAVIGAHCTLGQNVHVAGGARIGNNVRIQNNVSVYDGVELGDDVFCGPSAVFTNVINPRSHVNRKSEFRKTLVRRGATVGANATIVCGVTIGEYAFVGAGAVVTRDVPDYALVVGCPARHIGWVCRCGARLHPSDGHARCDRCGQAYSDEGGVLTPLRPVLAEVALPGPGKMPSDPPSVSVA